MSTGEKTLDKQIELLENAFEGIYNIAKEYYTIAQEYYKKAEKYKIENENLQKQIEDFQRKNQEMEQAIKQQQNNAKENNIEITQLCMTLNDKIKKIKEELDNTKDKLQVLDNIKKECSESSEMIYDIKKQLSSWNIVSENKIIEEKETIQVDKGTRNEEELWETE